MVKHNEIKQREKVQKRATNWTGQRSVLSGLSNPFVRFLRCSISLRLGLQWLHEVVNRQCVVHNTIWAVVFVDMFLRYINLTLWKENPDKVSRGEKDVFVENRSGVFCSLARLSSAGVLIDNIPQSVKPRLIQPGVL